MLALYILRYIELMVDFVLPVLYSVTHFLSLINLDFNINLT